MNVRGLLVVTITIGAACGPSHRSDPTLPGSLRAGERVAPVAPGPVEVVLPGVVAARDTIGTAHPTVLVAAPADRGWLAFCQARVADPGAPAPARLRVGRHGLEGDAPGRFLAIGGGDGAPIDRFVAASPDGRLVVVMADAALHLVDVAARTIEPLPGADNATQATSWVWPAARFSPDGRRLVYLAGDAVVVRDLASGEGRRLELAGSVGLRGFAGDGRLRVGLGVRDATGWRATVAVAHDPCDVGRGESYTLALPDDVLLELDTGAIEDVDERASPWVAVPTATELAGMPLVVTGSGGRIRVAPDPTLSVFPQVVDGPLRWVPDAPPATDWP